MKSSLFPAAFPPRGRSRRAILLSLGSAMALASHSLAATSSWTGGGSDGLMSTAGNWDTPPVTGDDLLFDSGVNLFVDNDLDSAATGSFVVNGITFGASADFFELDGNPIGFDGKTITNDSGVEQVVFLELQETGSGITVNGDGDLYLDNINTDGFGRPFVKNGAGRVEIGNTNDSWSLVQSGGTLIWGSNILFGTQLITGGTLEGAAGDILHSSAVLQLTSTTGVSTFKMAGATDTAFSVLEGAATSIVTNLGITGELSTMVLQGNGDSREFGGSLQDGDDGGLTALRLTGDSHTLVLSGPNTYSGDTTVEGGATLELSSTGSLTFFPQVGGDSNSISGAGTVVLDGTVNIDMSDVGTPSTGDRWVFVGSPAEYGPNFAVAAPFTETSPGLWSYNDGTSDYYFSEISGVSSYGVPPELIWDGGGGDDLWSTADNWNAAPSTGAFAVFDGTTQLTNTNDLDTFFRPYHSSVPTDDDPHTPTFEFSGFLFQPTAGAFTIEGNDLVVGSRTITNKSPNTQTFNAPIQVEHGVGGFTVDTGEGEVVFSGGINLYGGFNDDMIKTGSGTLSITGELIGPDTFKAVVNEGTLYADPGENLFFHCDIAAGAVLESGPTAANGVIHNGGNVTNNGTLIIGEGVSEDVGDLGGEGIVTNSGTAGTVSTLAMRNERARTFAGSIQDGPDGGATALQVGLAGKSGSHLYTLTGENSYTGDTVMGQPNSAFQLTDTGTMRFKIGADAENTQITGLQPQNAGRTVQLDGTIIIDMSTADATEGNAWQIIDNGNVNSLFGSTFNVIADDGMTQTPFTGDPGSGIWTYNDGVTNYSFIQATGELTYGRTPLTFWAGGGGDANWSSTANWDRAPLSGDQFGFGGSTQLTNNNDLDTTGAFVVEGITFGADAGAFTLQGNSIAFSGKEIANNSTSTQTLDLGLEIDDAVGGLTIDTAMGDVVLNSLTLSNGTNTDLVKKGSGSLFINGPLGSANSFEAILNGGSIVASQSAPSVDSLFLDVTVAAGATFTTDGDAALGVIDNEGILALEGTLDLGEGVTEDVGILRGGGSVTNHGAGGTTSTLRIRSFSDEEFSGSIQDGASGGVTALEIGIPGESDNGVFTFSGVSSSSGNTTLMQEEASFVLAETGLSSFWVGANGVNNQFSATSPQTGGLTDFNGTFLLDLSGANMSDGNAWNLVDVASLNQEFGLTFKVVNGSFVPATSFAVSAGGNASGDFEDAAPYVSGGLTENRGDTATIPAELVNPAPESVYLSSLIRGHTYTFTGLGAGSAYTVRFHAAELWGGTGAGGRVSDIYINGELAYDNHDPFSLGGATFVASITEVTANSDLAGNMVIEIRPDAASPDQNCRMNGIELMPVGGAMGADFTESGGTWTMTEGMNTWSFGEADGVLRLATGGGGSNYNTWAAANGIAGEPPTGDFDLDGILNVIEYALDGLDPTVSDAAPGTMVGNTLSYTKRAEAVANGDVSYAIEASIDLGMGVDWVTVTPDVNDSTTISYTFPGLVPADFARLNVQ